LASNPPMLPLNFLNPFRFWPQLPLLSRLFLFFLLGVSLYVVIRLTGLSWRPGRHERLQSAEAASPHAFTSLAAIGLGNIRQLLLLTFYLFAVFFFVFQLPAAFVTFGDSHRSGYSIILEQLDLTFSYSADVMLVLLSLHTLQWIVSYRLKRTSSPAA
jgi:hypothetical protein